MSTQSKVIAYQATPRTIRVTYLDEGVAVNATGLTPRLQIGAKPSKDAPAAAAYLTVTGSMVGSPLDGVATFALTAAQLVTLGLGVWYVQAELTDLAAAGVLIKAAPFLLEIIPGVQNTVQ